MTFRSGHLEPEQAAETRQALLAVEGFLAPHMLSCYGLLEFENLREDRLRKRPADDPRSLPDHG